MSILTPFDAIVLGIVEGLTEFLPISSTGHLILAGRALGLDLEDKGIKAFEIVIQSGALLAVIGMYFARVRSMLIGILGRDRGGLALALQLIVAFLPAAIVGLAFGEWIKDHLFGVWPVVIALAVGGVAMIVVERWRLHRAKMVDLSAGRPLADMTLRFALIIGLAQCLAMWPGTSRSMVTILAALLLGFSPRTAAEFSFLLALPTLGAATAHDLLKDGGLILQSAGWIGLLLGFVTSFIVAWLAVKGFLHYLTRHGMTIFGWYRIFLACCVAIFLLA